jgi:hypothetical protein
MPAANCFCIVRCHQVLKYNWLDVLSLACVACQGAFEMMFSELMMVAAMQDVTVIVLLISGIVSTVLGLALEGQGGDSWIEVTARRFCYKGCSSLPRPCSAADRVTCVGCMVLIHALHATQGAAIMAAVAVVVLVTAVNNYQKEQQFRALNQINDDIKVGICKCTVPI